MRLFDAEPLIVQDLKDESDVLTEKSGISFTVVTARHPTLGKLVIIIGKDGSGVVVETDE
jgi:hypothetical protein